MTWANFAAVFLGVLSANLVTVCTLSIIFALIDRNKKGRY